MAGLPRGAAGAGREAAAWTLVAAACTAPWMLHDGAAALAPWLTVDDAYYYLLSAWHRVHAGFPTVDGIHPTNGVQLLWYWCLVGLATLAEDRAALLSAALWLCALLVILAVPLALRAGRAIGGAGLGTAFALAVLWLGQRERLFFSGLETALYLSMILLSLWAYAELLRRPSTLRLALLALALGAAVLCRLDAAVWAAVLALHAAVELALERRRRGLPVAGSLGAGLVVGVAVVALQLASFRRMGGSWLPVSMLWKRVWSATGETPHPDFPPLSPGRALARVVGQIGDAFGLAGGSRWAGALLAGLLGLSLVLVARSALAWAADGSRRRDEPVDSEAGRLARGVLVAVAGVALHTLCLAATADRPWGWYFVPALVIAALLLASLVARLRDPRLVERSGRWPWRLGVAVLALCALASAAGRWLEVSSPVSGASLASERIALADWMRRNLPADTRVGSLNSGELGFFSELPVTNLDGLANSAAYYRYRRSGGSLLAYLRAEGICHYADYNVPAGIATHSVVLHRRSLAAVAGTPQHRTLEVRRLEDCPPTPEPGGAGTPRAAAR